MRFFAAGALLAAFAAAQQANSEPASTDTSTVDAALTTGISAESAIRFSEAADVNTVTSITANGEPKDTTTTTSDQHKPSSIDYSSLGCTQWTTVSGTVSPLCQLETTTIETTAIQTVPTTSIKLATKSSPFVEPSGVPTEATTDRTAPTGLSSSLSHSRSVITDPLLSTSTELVPIHPTEEPHSDRMTSSSTRHKPMLPHAEPTSTDTTTTSTQPILPPPASWTLDSHNSSHTVYLNSSSSSTFTTKTRNATAPPGNGPAAPSQTKSRSHSKSRVNTESVIHSSPPQAGGYTMTTHLTMTVSSTNTIQPHTTHTLRSTVTRTTVVFVTACHEPKPEPTKSDCEDKTVTKTITDKITVTKHQIKPAKSTEFYALISQLSDGQINGEPVPASTSTEMHDSPVKPSSVSIHGPPAEATPHSSPAGHEQRSSWSSHPHGPNGGMPHGIDGVTYWGTKSRDPENPHFTNPSQQNGTSSFPGHHGSSKPSLKYA